MPPDNANTVECTSLCSELRFTSSTLSRAVLVDRQSSTISLGPVRVAICISPIASRWKGQAFMERCHSSIHAPTNGTTTSAGTAITSPGSHQSVERPLMCFCSITNAEPRFVKLKRCSISFRRAMSSHSHSRRCLTPAPSVGSGETVHVVVGIELVQPAASGVFAIQPFRYSLFTA